MRMVAERRKPMRSVSSCVSHPLQDQRGKVVKRHEVPRLAQPVLRDPPVGALLEVLKRQPERVLPWVRGADRICGSPGCVQFPAPGAGD